MITGLAAAAAAACGGRAAGPPPAPPPALVQTQEVRQVPLEERSDVRRHGPVALLDRHQAGGRRVLGRCGAAGQTVPAGDAAVPDRPGPAAGGGEQPGRGARRPGAATTFAEQQLDRAGRCSRPGPAASRTSTRKGELRCGRFPAPVPRRARAPAARDARRLRRARAVGRHGWRHPGPGRHARDLRHPAHDDRP